VPAQMRALPIVIAAALCAGAGARASQTETGAASPAALASAVKPLVGHEDQGADDFALRYYAALNQSARVNAEISRLQRLYPGYEPPQDLYSAPTEGALVDEEPFWQLYSADKVDELRGAIAAKQREVPGWKPTRDLATKLHRKELRQKVSAFWADGRWQDLVEYIKSEDLAGLDADVDILWTIGEAFARTKQTDDAVAIYKSILASAKDKQVRVGTIQKAMATLRMNEVEKLLEAAPGQAGDYSAIMVDITRARIAAFLHDERAKDLPAADLSQFQSYARDSREADQMGLVAWHAYKRRDFPVALEWFKAAIGGAGADATIAHGLAHTLRALDKMREAEEVAYAWREPLVNNVILFIDLLERDLSRETPPFIEPDRLIRYARVTAEVASGEGAQALGWYAYNSCQFDVAYWWFERAMAWYPKDATVYGYALAARRLKKEKDFYEVANRYDGLHSKIVELLFPDGYYHPPTRCEQKGADRLHGRALKTAQFWAPGPATIPGAAPNYDPTAWTPLEAQKNVTATVSQDVLRSRVLKTIRGKFPAAVATENPVRHRPLGMAVVRSAANPPPAPQPPETPWFADPGRGLSPLVARRVPGIGPMPYEAYGFTLLPGWNGVTAPTWPPAASQVAPAGTAWATQDADPARAGMQAGGASAMYGSPPVAPAASLPTASTPAPTPAQARSAAGPRLVEPRQIPTPPRRGPALGQYQPGSR